jgi:hypothetical protein
MCAGLMCGCRYVRMLEAALKLLPLPLALSVTSYNEWGEGEEQGAGGPVRRPIYSSDLSRRLPPLQARKSRRPSLEHRSRAVSITTTRPTAPSCIWN